MIEIYHIDADELDSFLSNPKSKGFNFALIEASVTAIGSANDWRALKPSESGIMFQNIFEMFLSTFLVILLLTNFGRSVHQQSLQSTYYNMFYLGL